ncbi:MAG: low molecular weight phosphotyrosine protein phosphatase [Lachnospiraceae bacterium]|nr:low molecular weight phosphotyrosine protein phosphatase [Lachnospiraceae bacterium]
MIKVLFICHGNICRSPMAEFVMKDLLVKKGLADQFYIASAATSTEEIWNGVGNPVYPPAKKELAKHGISCEGKRAVQVTKADYARYDYLICMDSNNVRNLTRIIGPDVDNKVSMLLDYAGRQGQSIADPWYLGDFGATYRDVVAGCEGLIEKLTERN